MEKFDWKKFFAGFGSVTGWFKALAIGVRAAIIIVAVLGALWTVNKVRSMFKPKSEVSKQAQAQGGIFTGTVGTLTFSQPVNVDYAKIADIVESKQKTKYVGLIASLNTEKTSEKNVGIEAGILF